VLQERRETGLCKAIFLVNAYLGYKARKYARNALEQLQALQVCPGFTIDASRPTCRVQAVLAFDPHFIQKAKGLEVRIFPLSSIKNDKTIDGSDNSSFRFPK
jgi:hypothetical protein